jgi:DNA polymerase IV
MAVAEPILHVDMDAFYASVEVAKDPGLRGKPVIVGGLAGRGVVTSASYEARVFGVRSAMPTITAHRLCPDGIYLSNDFDAYVEFSQRIKEVFDSYSPLVEPLSLDEAFIDVGGSVKLFGSPVDIARRIKQDISALGLPCTVGVAPNKYLAKLASAQGKPNGLLVIKADAIQQFLHPLPVEVLWGVGAATAETLRRLGLKSVGDVATIPRRTLERAIGDSLGAHLHDLANGVDDRRVTPHEPAKSVGSEETFSSDLDDTVVILREILRLADRTASRLREKGMCGRTVTLKVRWSNFKTITRSRTMPAELDNAAEIYEAVRGLYLKLDPQRPRIRLLGVSVSSLAPGPPRRQLLLDDSGRAAWNEAARAVDDIRRRFGDEAVTPATLLDRNPQVGFDQTAKTVSAGGNRGKRTN